MSDSIKLSQLKAKIDKMKTEVTMEEGNLAVLKRELKEDFGCASVKEAKEKSDNLYTRADALRKRLEEGIHMPRAWSENQFF